MSSSSAASEWNADEAFDRLKKQIRAQNASKKQKTDDGYRPAGSSGVFRLTEKQVRHSALSPYCHTRIHFHFSTALVSP